MGNEWLDSLGSGCSGSSRVKKKTIFFVSFFFFWKSFKNVLLWTAAQVSYSVVKIIASFSVIEDLVLPSRSRLWTVCSVCLINVWTHNTGGVCVHVCERGERERMLGWTYKSIITPRMYSRSCLKQSNKPQIYRIALTLDKLTLFLWIPMNPGYLTPVKQQGRAEGTHMSFGVRQI